VGRADQLQPIEILRAEAEERTTSPPPALARRSNHQLPPRLTIRLNWWDGFALGALAVAALALAWTLGRRTPLIESATSPPASRCLEDIRRQAPIAYQDLPVDRGSLDPAAVAEKP
jgi:hypothetical protein